MLKAPGLPGTPAAQIPRAVTGEPKQTIPQVATEELVSKAQSGDNEAYAMIFKRFHDEIYRFATRRLGDPETGQDVAADTFADAFAGISRFRWRGVPFEAWLYTIARRRVTDRLRARERAGRLRPETTTREDHSGAIADRIDVRALIARLSPSEREVIELRFMEDLDVDQTARRLGKNAGAVRVAQHRALARLRVLMQGMA